MSGIVAKPVVKNKFWILEEDGTKVGTIQAVDEVGGVVLVKDTNREVFPSIKTLSKKYNIRVENKIIAQSHKPLEYEIYGYPTPHKPHNILYNVQKHLPVFTKSAKSKSYFCAGHYLIKFNQSWCKSYCPKAITLNRYEFLGPFKTSSEANQLLRTLNGSTHEFTNQKLQRQNQVDESNTKQTTGTECR